MVGYMLEDLLPITGIMDTAQAATKQVGMSFSLAANHGFLNAHHWDIALFRINILT